MILLLRNQQHQHRPSKFIQIGPAERRVDVPDKTKSVPTTKERTEKTITTYTFQNKRTGRQVTFEWNDPNPPTEADLEEVFAVAEEKQFNSLLSG